MITIHLYKQQQDYKNLNDVSISKINHSRRGDIIPNTIKFCMDCIVSLENKFNIIDNKITQKIQVINTT